MENFMMKYWLQFVCAISKAVAKVWLGDSNQSDKGGHRSETKAEKRKSAGAAQLTQQVKQFLTEHYDFRYNCLTCEPEFRPAGMRSVAFRPVGKRELNTLCLDAHAVGIACWDKDLNRYIQSSYIPEYHPFHLYMEELPEWDGKDRLTDLAERVSSHPVWVKGLHTWLLAMASQWMGMQRVHANSVAPLLVSREQGLQKSTFCRSLMPPVLMRYYADNLKLTSPEQAERLLAEMGLLNMDEFDKYAETRMPLLKNLMQMNTLHIRRAYQQNYQQLPRIASFIGTSNRFDLLTDPTGSRRFLCVEVEHAIDCTGIDHDQIYAQLKAELLAGERSWFTKDEERAIQRYNRRFQRFTPVEELLISRYRAPEEDEDCLTLSAAVLFTELQHDYPAVMRGCNPMRFGLMLVRAGLKKKHTEVGNVYEVVRRETFAEAA